MNSRLFIRSPRRNATEVMATWPSKSAIDLIITSPPYWDAVISDGEMAPWPIVPGLSRRGADTGTPVANDYQVPFRFTGKLDKLTLTIDRPKLTPADIEKLREANRAAQDAK